MRRGIAGIAAVAAAIALTPGVAQANHHLVSISEVSASAPDSAGAEFVEFRMYGAGQGAFSPAASIVFYNSAGTTGMLSLPTVPLQQNQDTLLVISQAGEGEYGVQGDLDYTGDLLDGTGGGACLTSTSFGTIDCVAWGSATNVPQTGTPAVAIPLGQSLTRDTSAGCNTLLEAVDDTNQSSSDFGLSIPTPEPNAAVNAGSSCPNTSFTKTPKAKTTKRSPTFNMEGSSTFECKLDGGDFSDCTSPYKPGKLKLGKHKLQVRATEEDGSIDGTPATFSWKIVKKKKKN